MHKIKNGVWEISDTVMGPKQERGDGVWGAEFHMGGEPHRRNRNRAVAATFTPLGELAFEVAAEKHAAATILTINTSTGSVLVREGRFVRASDGSLAFMNKGASRNGIYLKDLAILDVVLGYSGPHPLDRKWQEHDAMLPATGKVTIDGIPELPDDEQGYDEDGEPLVPEVIHAVYLVNHPGFGAGGECATTGCMFLARDVQADADDPDNTIVNGYLWVPEGSQLTAEHGSQYLGQLRRWGARVLDYTPGTVTFRQAVMEEIPTDPAQAWDFVLGRASVSA